MLNKILWDIVVKLDPGARVHDEDDPGECQLPVDERVGLFGKGSFRQSPYARMVRWGECYSMNCPTCGDTRGRLYICHRFGTSMRSGSRNIRFGRKGMVHCHNEDCQVNEFHRDSFWKWLNSRIDLPRQYASTAIAADTGPRELDPSSLHLMADIALPEPRYSLFADETPSEVVRYLQDRGFDPHALDSHWHICYSPRGAEYQDSSGAVRTLQSGRIIIPVWQHNRCVYWQARALSGADMPKYINPGVSKTSLLYNVDNAMLFPNICIFEGATNCWRFGPASIALLGKGLNQGQKAVMKTLWKYDGLGVVCLDEDTYTPDKFGIVHNTDLRRAQDIIRSGVFPRGVAVMRLRGGDGAEHDPRRLWQLFHMAVERAVLDPDKITDAVVDEKDVPVPPAEDERPPAVDELVSEKQDLEIVDEDGLDGDWETADVWLEKQLYGEEEDA